MLTPIPESIRISGKNERVDSAASGSQGRRRISVPTLSSEFVRHLHGILLERFIIVLGLTIYADESGTHDEHGVRPGSEVTVVGGYIATKKNWEIFTRRWNTACRAYGLERGFHMSSYWRKEKPYGDWSDAKRKRCLKTFIRIARDNTWFAIAGMVTTKDFDELMGAAARGTGYFGSLNFSHPYHFCFQMLFVRFRDYLTNEIDERFPRKDGQKETVAFVFDRQQQFQKLADAGFPIIKDLIDPDDRFTSITFGSKEKYIPLQAADLLAFYARRMLTHQNQGKAWQDPFERMMEERHNLMLHYFTRGQMEEFAKGLAELDRKRHA